MDGFLKMFWGWEMFAGIKKTVILKKISLEADINWWAPAAKVLENIFQFGGDHTKGRAKIENNVEWWSYPPNATKTEKTAA